jgi:integrase
MAERRGRGEGGLYWDEARQRFIAEVTIGYTPAGKRIVRRGSGKTKTEARAKLKQVMRDHEDGIALASQHTTVAVAVNDWLDYGLTSVGESTVEKYRILMRCHVIADLGARKLRDLSAADVDRWLAQKAAVLSTSTVKRLHECLNRAVNRAMARDLVKRNVVALCKTPKGLVGRPSKSLDLQQARAILAAAEESPLYAYVTVSLLAGGRTEELRALTWGHVDLDGAPNADPPKPPSIEVWRSVRDGGDTKTRKSRRTLGLPQRAVLALRIHRDVQKVVLCGAGANWRDTGLVFTSTVGTGLDAANVRRGFRRVAQAAGLNAQEWTPRELRHSFVSLLSDSGMRLEDIAELCGHAGTRVTEAVYRHQLRPVLLKGAAAMDEIFDPIAEMAPTEEAAEEA